MNKNDIIKKALGLKSEQDSLTEDIKKTTKHLESLRKLEKNQRITPQEDKDMSDIKEDYQDFFDSDSESETSGKTPSWEKDKVKQVLEYLKGEKSVNVSEYQEIAKNNPDIFNVLKNKVTKQLHINIKPDVLKAFNDNHNNTNLDINLPNTNVQETGKLNSETFKDNDISDSKPNKGSANSNAEEKIIKKESVSEFLDSLPLDHNPFEDIGGGD